MHLAKLHSEKALHWEIFHFIADGLAARPKEHYLEELCLQGSFTHLAFGLWSLFCAGLIFFYLFSSIFLYILFLSFTYSAFVYLAIKQLIWGVGKKDLQERDSVLKKSGLSIFYETLFTIRNLNTERYFMIVRNYCLCLGVILVLKLC